MAKGNFGERLKRERELREVSVEELTKATRISRRFLEALENEDWGGIPGGVFGHGFVRSIARYLGLDEESLLGEYDLARADKFPLSAPKPEERIPPPPKWIPVAVVLVILVLLVGFSFGARYGWRRLMAHRAGKPSTTLDSLPIQANSSGTAPVTTADPASTDATAAALSLSVSTSAATRVRVLGDDKLLLDAELPAGETRRFSANERFEVTAADSSAVLLEMNGKAMPPIGAPGSSGRIVLTKEDLR